MDPLSSSAPRSFYVQRIDSEIARYNAMKNRALTVSQIALQIFAIGLIITALFYTSPIIPILTGVLISFVLLLCVAGSNTVVYPHGEALFYPIVAGWHGGIKLGQTIYTAEIATVVGLTNAAIATPTFVVAAMGGGVYFYANRQIKQLEELGEWHRNPVEGQPNLPIYLEAKFGYLQQ